MYKIKVEGGGEGSLKPQKEDVEYIFTSCLSKIGLVPCSTGKGTIVNYPRVENFTYALIMVICTNSTLRNPYTIPFRRGSTVYI